MLEIRDVTKHYGDVTALDRASFVAAPGRILGFLGPNGAGKTTAMRSVFGLVEPDSGTIEWNGGSVTHEARLRFGYMPEERGLYPKMRVREQLVHFARLSGLGSDSGAAADRWLRRLGLGDRADAKVEQLSHGNQQRVQLAAALVHDPVVAVLDEPFSGLDPLGIDALSAVLREMANQGVAIVFSSHQLDLVEDVCEDVAIIDHGRVVLTGRLDDLRAGSKTRRLEVQVDGMPWGPALPGVELVANQGRPHYVVTGDVPVGEILAAAQEAGRLDRFSFEPPRVSDLFREAVPR
jgi:ABC-2 type transport system ATP-binding protein